MDGFPLRDQTPLAKTISDSKPENTYIDAFSQTLAHQVTDAYIPIPGTEIAISVRRNTSPGLWSSQGSLHPNERPDRPFGVGWSSGLGASVEIVTPAPVLRDGVLRTESPTMAIATDEEGASYRFMVLPYADGGLSFIHLPSDGSEEGADAAQLSVPPTGGFRLTKKHGTTVDYKELDSALTKYAAVPDADAPGGARGSARHEWGMIDSVTLRSGEKIVYTASSVSYRGTSISIGRNAEGRVTSITDPAGNTTTFHYTTGVTTFHLLLGEEETVLLDRVERPDGSETSFGYSEANEMDTTPRPPGSLAQPNFYYHVEVDQIGDANGNTYSFTYAFDHSRFNYIFTAYANGPYLSVGNPRIVTDINLPDGGSVSLTRQGTTQLGSADGSTTFSGVHNLVVNDAGGGSWKYFFTDATVRRLDEYVPGAFPEPPMVNDYPYIIVYGDMSLQAPIGSIEMDFSYEGQLTRYRDITGGDYTFTYGAGNLVSQKDPQNLETAFQYGAYNRISKITDAAGRVTDRAIGPKGRLDSETVKDSQGNVVSRTDYSYGDPSHISIPTQRIVRKGSSDPAWAVDILTTYQLDNFGNVTWENTGGALTQYAYDANHNKTSTTDPNGNITTFVYDELNRITEIDPPGPGKKLMFYDAYGNKIREQDERGISTLWEFNGRNRVVKEARDMNGDHLIDAGDLVTTTTYNLLGSKTAVTDPKGNATTFEYDALQRLTKVTDAAGKITTHEYGANSGGIQFGDGFRPTRSVDPRGFETLTTYDASFRPVEKKVQHALDGTTPVYAVSTVEYDPVGNVLEETDPLGRETTHVYDAKNRKISTEWADGTTVQAFYTFSGLPWKSVDELGKDTLTEFDSAGRPVKISSPEVDNGLGTNARAVTQTEYDDAGNVVETINPLGRSWTFEYDNRNRKVKEIRPGTGSPTLEWVYDAAGNVTKVIDARGAETETIYDAANRAMEIKQPLVAVYGSGTSRPTTFSEFDKNGNVVKLTDPNGHETNNTYDELNRLVATEDAEGIIVENEYDEVGNKTAVIDGEEQRTEFEYDGLNRNTKITDAANKSTTFEFDAVNKVAREDAKGQRTEYGYDNRNRLIAVNYSGRSQDNREYAYDATGNLLAVTEPHASKAGKADVAYSYDALKRQLTETSGGLTHVYKYDLAGNRIYCLYGGQTVPLISAYDEQNRLTTLTEGTRATTYGYDFNGNILTKTLPNGDVVTSLFDALNRTTSMIGASGASAALYSYVYGYDAAGNVKRVTESYGDVSLNRVVTNTYDDINRLTQEAVTGSGTETTAFTYDDAHNRATMTKTGVTTNYTYNSLNQLTGFVAQYPSGSYVLKYAYDLNGNQTMVTDESPWRSGSVLLKAYGYDYENRLVSVSGEWAALPGGEPFTYMYDYRSRRVETCQETDFITDVSTGIPTMTAVAVRRKIVFSGGTSVYEHPSVGHDVYYVRGSDYGGGVGGILYTIRNATASFTHNNRRGDIVAKTNGAGAITYQAEYEAFGTRVAEVGSTSDRQKANSKDEDPTGLLNEGFRYRDLETGVFITRDPAGFIDGPNLYTYVRQNPWTKFDPRGLSDDDARAVAALLQSDPNTQAMAESVGQQTQQGANVQKVADGVKAGANAIASMNPVQNAITAGTGKDASGDKVSGFEQGMAVGGVVGGAGGGLIKIGGKVFAKIGGKLVEVSKAAVQKLFTLTGGKITKSSTSVVKSASDIVEDTTEMVTIYHKGNLDSAGKTRLSTTSTREEAEALAREGDVYSAQVTKQEYQQMQDANQVRETTTLDNGVKVQEKEFSGAAAKKIREQMKKNAENPPS